MLYIISLINDLHLLLLYSLIVLLKKHMVQNGTRSLPNLHCSVMSKLKKENYKNGTQC